ncbi:MAG: hypothetical protein MUF84_09110 [Anaerolineae bacterium]|jgi:hypothetical protein|nr:hypothetical protein [Anaerolineae bacterium]
MVQTAFLVALVSAGVVVALQGYLVIRGKRRPFVTYPERKLLEALPLKAEAQKLQALGRLRVVYGIFLAVVGLWGLAA